MPPVRTVMTTVHILSSESPWPVSCLGPCR